MKLYDFALAPNPRRVRMYLAEKGIEVPTVQINLREGEQFQDDFKNKNPQLTVPCLELDDGSVIAESIAICRYFEALHPEPALFGTTPEEQGVVEMWSRRTELEGFMGVAEALRNSSDRFNNRALTGPRNYAQIPALAERGKRRVQGFLEDLDAHLAHTEFVAGDFFSIADINAFVTVEFAAWIEERPSADMVNLQRWHQTIAARPSAAA